MKLSCLFFLLSLSIAGFTQPKMRPADQLVNRSEPGWPMVEQWIRSARNKVDVLPGDTVRGKDALYKTQVTSRSPMGAIIYASGGLLIEGGWIRILGSGHPRLNRSLPDWNRGKSFSEFGEPPTYLLIADDAAGGFFALNGGALGKDPGKVYYFSPDQTEWEPLNLTYTDFLNFCFNSDLSEFYKELRWTSWAEDLKTLTGNQVFSFFPFLWTKEGSDINKIERKVVTIEEHYRSRFSSK